MISWGKFEIRIVLYENGLMAPLSVFLSTWFSLRFCNFSSEWYFFISLNYWNLHGCRTLPRKQYLINLAWFCKKKPLKSGLYFYENCPPVKIISCSHRTLSSVIHSIHSFITRLQKRIFGCSWIIEMSNHVWHYWENEFWYSFNDFAKKLWNPDSTLRKRPFFRSHNDRSLSQHKIQFTAL